jgi:hypothetical protein
MFKNLLFDIEIYFKSYIIKKEIVESFMNDNLNNQNYNQQIKNLTFLLKFMFNSKKNIISNSVIGCGGNFSFIFDG